MRELDKSKVYDLSELTKEERIQTFNSIGGIYGIKEFDFSEPDNDLILFHDNKWEWYSVSWAKAYPDEKLTNAKELFYTLENIKVDCTELSEEHIKNMKEVVLSLGYSLRDDETAFIVGRLFRFFNKNESDNDFQIDRGVFGKTEITYDKFMELFGEKKEEVDDFDEFFQSIDMSKGADEEYYKGNPVFELIGGIKPDHYSQGIDTFARMEANCTKEECLAFAKGNIDKYNWRNKDQDVEDFKKIIQYANWALKVHAEK